MYIIRDKRNRDILIEYGSAYDEQIRAKDIYPKFDSQTMEMAWTDENDFPQYFDIAKDGKAIELTLKQALVAGHWVLEDTQKIVNNKVVPKTNRELVDEGITKIDPTFDYIDDNDAIQRYTIAELVEKQLLKTRASVDDCLSDLGRQIEEAIASEYSVGYESKLAKRYLEWSLEGKPANDRRERKYRIMQQRIDAIRLQYKVLREKLKAIRSTLAA